MGAPQRTSAILSGSGRHRARRHRSRRSALPAWTSIVRRDMPYSGYEKFQFKVPVSDRGDVWARYTVRIEEMRESVKICQQALDGMPKAGPIHADSPKVILPDREQMKTQMESMIHHFKIVTEGFAVPAGEVFQAVESPRGEMGYYVVSDGTAKPYRVHMRNPLLRHPPGPRDHVQGPPPCRRRRRHRIH